MSLQALDRFRAVGRWVRVQIKPLAWIIRPWVRLFGEGQHLVAGHLAYTTVLALPAFLIFILAAAKLLGQQGAILHLMEVMLAATPADLEQPVRSAITDMLARPALGFFTLGLASSLWISSGLLDALRQGLNRAYGASAPGSYWRLRVQAVGMTVLFGGLLIVLGILLLYLPLAQQAVTASVGIEGTDNAEKLAADPALFSDCCGKSDGAPLLATAVSNATLASARYSHQHCTLAGLALCVCGELSRPGADWRDLRRTCRRRGAATLFLSLSAYLSLRRLPKRRNCNRELAAKGKRWW